LVATILLDVLIGEHADGGNCAGNATQEFDEGSPRLVTMINKRKARASEVRKQAFVMKLFIGEAEVGSVLGRRQGTKAWSFI
jgi:hypothetical protein